jgi:hypothetical protein
MNDRPTPEITVLETAIAASTDLAELATALALPGDPAASARVADKISEEVAELAFMIRSLPGRPPRQEMTGYDYQLLSGLATAHQAGEDVAETIARALAHLASELGGSERVLANRPGSWEASHIRGLLAGTLGDDDSGLPLYGGPGGSL